MFLSLPYNKILLNYIFIFLFSVKILRSKMWVKLYNSNIFKWNIWRISVLNIKKNNNKSHLWNWKYFIWVYLNFRYLKIYLLKISSNLFVKNFFPSPRELIMTGDREERGQQKLLLTQKESEWFKLPPTVKVRANMMHCSWLA